MTAIPCKYDTSDRRKKVDEYVEALKLEAHKIGAHGLSEQDFYESGFFRAVLERVRGQNSASMGEKRDFVQRVLSILEERGYIKEWESAGNQNRYDYDIFFPDGRRAAIELKGCLDGNNTTIFERPNHAQEFVIWSVCANRFSDMDHNAWSGLHTRLSAEIILGNKHVDGLIIWDWVCGSKERPCPKLRSPAPDILVSIGPHTLPPPCLYVLPSTVPSVRNNPAPKYPELRELRLLNAFHKCFGGSDNFLNYVSFEVQQVGQEIVRRTTIKRDEAVVRQSGFTPLRRS